MRTRRVALAVVGCALAATTAACSAHPGVAAVVDGREIDEAYVQDTVDDLLPYFQSVTPEQVLTVLVNAPALLEVAENHGIVASEDDIMALLQSGATSAGVTDATFGPGAIEVARYSVVGAGLGELDVDEAQVAAISAELDAARAALDVEVSPRYGEVADGGMITAITPEWIVGPASDEELAAP